MVHGKSLGRRRKWYNPASIWRSIVMRPRIYASVLAAAVVLWLLPPTVALPLRFASAWCIGGVIYLALAFAVMQRCGVDLIRRRAARQDDSALVILVIVLLAIASSFAAIIALLTEARSPTASPDTKALCLALAGATIVVSWLVTQLAFTFHYAHEHYAPDRGHAAAGLVFPDDDHPDYWDFFYFATSIGATSQTSDTMIRSKSLRRLVTLHAIVSFFFNTMVLAMTINLAAGLS